MTNKQNNTQRKQALRARLLVARIGLHKAYAKTAGNAFSAMFDQAMENGHIPAKMLAEVASYVAMHSEACPADLCRHLGQKGSKLSLPVVAKKNDALVFRRFRVGDNLDRGVYGTSHPLADNPEIMPTLVIVPLVAFDSRGYRIGYGGGYYDRTLDKLEKAGHSFKTVGLAYSGQQIKKVPAEPHDKPLDMVLTNTQLHVFSNNG